MPPISPSPFWYRIKAGSYFGECERDDEGRCLPSGRAGQQKPEEGRKPSPSSTPKEPDKTDAEETPKPKYPGIVGDGNSPQPGEVAEERKKKKEEEDNEKPVTFTSQADRAKAFEYAQKTYKGWASDLTPEQLKALKVYGGNAHHPINNSLRRGNLPHDEYVKTIKDLDDAIEAAPPTSTPVVAYRGVGVGVANQMTPGKEFTDHGYSSTSINKHIAHGFAEDALIEVSIPKGARLAAMDAISDDPEDTENEFLLPRGTRYRVTGKRRDPEYGTVITVEVI